MYIYVCVSMFVCMYAAVLILYVGMSFIEYICWGRSKKSEYFFGPSHENHLYLVTIYVVALDKKKIAPGLCYAPLLWRWK